jgi:hypothetical protein
MDDPDQRHCDMSEPPRRIVCHGIDRRSRKHRIVVKLVDEASIESDTVVAVDVPERPMPGVTAAGAAKFVAATVGALPMAGDEEVSRRSAACLGCEHFDLGRCRACGCYLWPKVRLAGERCPEERW